MPRQLKNEASFTTDKNNKKLITNKNLKKIIIMNALRNKVQLIGHLGQDPESKTIGTGKKVLNVSIATNETYKNAKGEKVTETQWHNVVAWEKNADIMEKYLKKGSEVAIEGKLINRNYTDKDGNKKYVSEVLVNDVLLLGSANKTK